MKINNVRDVITNGEAFVALKLDNSVETWGNSYLGGNIDFYGNISSNLLCDNSPLRNKSSASKILLNLSFPVII